MVEVHQDEPDRVVMDLMAKLNESVTFKGMDTTRRGEENLGLKRQERALRAFFFEQLQSSRDRSVGHANEQLSGEKCKVCRRVAGRFTHMAIDRSDVQL